MNLASQENLAAFVSQVVKYTGANQLRQAILARGAALAVDLARPTRIDYSPTDVLVIHASPYISPGKRRLIECLSNDQGLRVNQYVMGDWRKIVARREFIRPSYRVLPQFALKAAVARYLVEKYRPKVIVVSTEDTIVPFLRFEINSHGGRLVNVAHSIVFPSPLFGMADFDYYFIYGQASLNSLRVNQSRFGSAKIVLTGSLDLSLHHELALDQMQNNRATYFSTWLPKKQEKTYLRQFAEVRSFAVNHPDWEVVIRRHPLESPVYWDRLAKRVVNIRVVDPVEPIAESVRHSCVTLCPSHSTTALDSVCLGRPPIILDCDEVGAQFYSSFPALKRKHGESIAMAIRRVMQDEASYRRVMQDFLTENLAQRTKVVETVAGHLSAVCRGIEISNSITLN